jgi:hypothetical protein
MRRLQVCASRFTPNENGDDTPTRNCREPCHSWQGKELSRKFSTATSAKHLTEQLGSFCQKRVLAFPQRLSGAKHVIHAAGHKNKNRKTTPCKVGRIGLLILLYFF